MKPQIAQTIIEVLVASISVIKEPVLEEVNAFLEFKYPF
jgi:hypothetical protein